VVAAMSLVENEQTKLLAAALNTAGTSAFAIGVLAPVAAGFYSVGSGRVSFMSILIGVAIWMSAAVILHLGARHVLTRLRP
jgi:hypothetical protein